MRISMVLRRSLAATVAAALAGTPSVGAPAAPKRAVRSGVRIGTPPVGTQRATTEIVLSTGQGELITLPAAVADVWLSNPGAADVYISNPRQIHLFGKDFGETTLFATSASGAVIYSANIRVSQNITSIDKMLKLAMPDADIKVTTVGQIAVITGTVATPDDSAQAQRLVTGLLNPGVDPSTATGLKIGVINRIRTATPLQVNLQVRFAEVSRSFVKNIGVRLNTNDRPGSGGSLLTQSNSGNAGTITYTINPITGQAVKTSTVTNGAFRSTLGIAGRVFGTDFLSAIDAGESEGQITTLANPNLTALSGETGTFLAGGEIPIPISQGLGAVSVEFKQYGISLSYTPTVLSDGRISLRVRPEVSQLDYANAVTVGGTAIPGLQTRRAETTVELGSGQSYMIAGLLQNNHSNTIDKTPGLGDVPVLGALFRSNGFKRNETELVIVITPYLVKPASANDIVLPTDGYKAPTDLGRVLLGDLGSGASGGSRPKPGMAPPVTATPAFGAVAPASPAPKADARREEKAIDPKSKAKQGADAAPGFSFN